MEELFTIFKLRQADILSLSMPQLPDRIELSHRERNRIQKENWIFKVTKNIKIPTVEANRKLYHMVCRIMEELGEIEINEYIRKVEEEGELQGGFTMEFVNLFVGFYGRYQPSEIAEVERIVRPNNAFVIVDLVAMLIETCREEIKGKMIEVYKDIPKVFPEKNKRLPSLPKKEVVLTEPAEAECFKEEKKFVSSKVSLSAKINQALYEKYESYISFSFLPEESIQDKFNDTYYSLLEKNSQNNFSIIKFQEKCYGKSKPFAYYIPGLYSNDEIKKMEEKSKEDVEERERNIGTLTGEITAEQMREHFKMKAEIQEIQDKIESKKQNFKPVNTIIPIVVNKFTTQHDPLGLSILFGKDLIPITEFTQKCGLTIKNYIQMLLKEKLEGNVKIDLSLFKNFKRHYFLDLNNAKKKELMIEQPRVYMKEKKESIFPMLRSNELKQEQAIALKNRSLSEHRLASFGRSERIEKGEQREKIDKSDKSDKIERIEKAKRLERVDRIESLQKIDLISQIQTDQAHEIRNLSKNQKKSQILRLNKSKYHLAPRSITTWIPFESDFGQVFPKAEKIEGIFINSINQKKN